MKKLVSVLLSAALLMGVAALPATAAEKTYGLGDVNMDGSVDAFDATWIMCAYLDRIASDTMTLSDAQLILADVDQNDVVDAADACYTLGYYAYQLALMPEITITEYIRDGWIFHSLGDEEIERFKRNGILLVMDEETGTFRCEEI